LRLPFVDHFLQKKRSKADGRNRTNGTNQLRSGNTGIYYGRVKHNENRNAAALGSPRWRA